MILKTWARLHLPRVPEAPPLLWPHPIKEPGQFVVLKMVWSYGQGQIGRLPEVAFVAQI